jgi:beta-glucosidase
MGVQLWFTDRLEKGVDRALDSDVIVLLLGEHPRMSGENANLSDPTLPSSQVAFVDKMVSLGKAVVLVVFAGRPLVITRQFSQADAVIYAWHPGIEGGAALGEILFGKYPPLGRLPITFPRAVGQIPVYYNHKNSGRPVRPSGEFRTRYLDLPPLPLFPFGYGLSYSNCIYDNLKLSDQKLIGEISISAEITNVGGSPISDLVQLYIRDLVGTVTRPIRELKGFQRVVLSPGETRQVIFKIDESMLTYTHNNGSRKADSGRFHAWIARDSASGLMAEFII